MITTLTQSILLLTTHLRKNGKHDVRPLNPAEWGRFARWLREQSLTPDRLLYGSPREILKDWHDAKITTERIEALLDRGSALALSVEKWLRSGLWIITRADVEYPAKLKEKLGNQAPPVLFGCGNRHLLNQGGVAVVGSRHVNASDLQYSRELGVLVANCGFSVISGGAKGVDEAAMLGALEVEGTAVGVLSNGLLKACSSQKYRDFLRQKSLVLISPFNPEAGFDVGNAMQRNKYIYCLSDVAVVVHSGTKGGTWTGALENIKKDWVPLWVKHINDPEAGNRFLVQKGARWLPDNVSEIECDMLFNKVVQGNLLSFEQPKTEQVIREKSLKKYRETTPVNEIQRETHNLQKSEDEVREQNIPYSTAKLANEITFYEFFLAKVQKLCSDKPRSVEELTLELGLQKSQINVWLKKALSDGVLKKLTKPVRYYWIKNKQEVLSLD